MQRSLSRVVEQEPLISESALAYKRGREKKRRSTVPPMTAEDRTHQWVLQQPDPVSHEPVS